MSQQEITLKAPLAQVKPVGFDLFCLGKKFLVYNLVSRNLIIKYRRSFLGLLWTLVAPTGLAAVYYFVFQKVMKIQIPHYLGFVLSGIFLWTYFSRTILEGTESLVGNFALLTKIPIPLQVFPLVVSVTHLVTLLMAVPVLLIAIHVSGAPVSLSMLIVPFYFIVLFLMSYGFALILALAFVYFRDLRHVMEILMQVWFYGTPVLYDANMIPEKFRWTLYANPVGLIFHHVHLTLIHGQFPPGKEVLWILGWTAAVTALAMLLYRKAGPGVAELL